MIFVYDDVIMAYWNNNCGFRVPTIWQLIYLRQFSKFSHEILHLIAKLFGSIYFLQILFKSVEI